MSTLQLLRVGPFEPALARELARQLEAEFQFPCEVLSRIADPEFAFHPERQQYHSSEILAWMETQIADATWRLLAVTAADLYIPILTFVFGEARLDGKTAVVSIHRLRQEFYGLPADSRLLRERLVRESVHELGHTFALRHCDDWECAMASSSSVEAIDLKGAALCSVCRARISGASSLATPGR
jgi:archaemetzincin